MVAALKELRDSTLLVAIRRTINVFKNILHMGNTDIVTAFELNHLS